MGSENGKTAFMQALLNVVHGNCQRQDGYRRKHKMNREMCFREHKAGRLAYNCHVQVSYASSWSDWRRIPPPDLEPVPPPWFRFEIWHEWGRVEKEAHPGKVTRRTLALNKPRIEFMLERMAKVSRNDR